MYPNHCGIPYKVMDEGMAQRKRTVLELAHPNASGIDGRALNTALWNSRSAWICHESRQSKAYKVSPRLKISSWLPT